MEIISIVAMIMIVLSMLLGIKIGTKLKQSNTQKQETQLPKLNKIFRSKEDKEQEKKDKERIEELNKVLKNINEY